MQAFTQIIPPTAVTHSASLSFLSSRSSDLVVAKTNLLQVFHIKTVTKSTRDGNEQDDSRPETESKLVLLGEFPLAGVVTSLARVKLLNTRSGGDALLVTFRDAKMSLVEWDPEAFSLYDISIHYYESLGERSDIFASDIGQYPSYAIVDPSGGCAALKFGKRSLAILPLKQAGDDVVMAEDEPATQTHGEQRQQNQRKTAYASSFVLPITLLDPSLLQPVHMAFLYEYRDPTLAVLSSARDFAHHLNRQDTLCYNVFTLDIEGRARTPLVSVSGLPSDLFRVIPLPLPIGGALLLGTNEVIHVDQSGKTHGLAVNEYARQMSAFPLSDQQDLALRLEHSIVLPLKNASGDLLLITRDGRFGIISFKLDGRLVAGLSAALVDADKGGELFKACPTTATALSSSSIFLGSDTSDSTLIRIKGAGDDKAIEKPHEVEEDEDDGMNDDDDLYGDDAGAVAKDRTSVNALVPENLSFLVEDVLPTLVAAGSPTFAREKSMLNAQVSSEETGNSPSGDSQLRMAVPTSSSVQGGLAFLSRTCRARKSPITGIQNSVQHAWHLQVASKLPSGKPDPASLDEVIMVSLKEVEDEQASKVFRKNGEAFTECENTDFEGALPTVHAGTLFNNTRVVQVTPSELRVLDSGMLLLFLCFESLTLSYMVCNQLRHEGPTSHCERSEVGVREHHADVSDGRQSEVDIVSIDATRSYRETLYPMKSSNTITISEHVSYFSNIAPP